MGMTEKKTLFENLVDTFIKLKDKITFVAY